jgi:hypothetical protein
MLADLLLTIAIATSTPAISTEATTVARVAPSAAPSCMTGPVRVRFRTQGGMVQIAASAIRVEGVDRPADAKVQPE